nr:MAG TPA: hypothetical protein [Caudoviricetes sp.]
MHDGESLDWYEWAVYASSTSISFDNKNRRYWLAIGY